MNINLTLIGQAIAFAMFVAFCMKFVWPPLINAISERQRKIADGLNAAEKADGPGVNKMPDSGYSSRFPASFHRCPQGQV